MKTLALGLLFPILAILSLLSCKVPDKIAPNQDLPRRYVCQRVRRPLVHDGKLNDPSWLRAPWTSDFVDILGTQGTPPYFRTRMKMLWDDTYLYFGVEMEETDLQASLTKHDSIIYRDNDFEVFIDPDGDTHNYFELEVNALGTTWDLSLNRPYRDGGKANNKWEIEGLLYHYHLNGTLNNPHDVDRGWTVEIAIPWKSMEGGAFHKGAPHHGEQWRINASRVQWRWNVENGTYVKKMDRRRKNLPEMNWSWTPQGVINMHRPEDWAYVQFSEKLVGEKDDFVMKPEERTKKILRDYHLAQRKFRRSKKTYCWDMNEEHFQDLLQTRTQNQPTISATKNGYLMSMRGPDNKSLWHIDPLGRVWQE